MYNHNQQVLGIPEAFRLLVGWVQDCISTIRPGNVIGLEPDCYFTLRTDGVSWSRLRANMLTSQKENRFPWEGSR